MAFPFNHRRDRAPSANPRSEHSSYEWRCHECGKLLGMRRGALLHIRVHGYDYSVSLPVKAVCRGCGSDNQT